MVHRLQRLSVFLCVFCLLGFALSAQQQPSSPPANPSDAAVAPQQEAPAAERPQAQQPPPPQPANPFEVVPEAKPEPPPAKPAAAQKPAFEAPAEAAPPKPAEIQNIVEAVEFRGARRVPQDTLRALIFTKKGDPFDEAQLRRDFMALWNTGRFDDITLEWEPGTSGKIVRFLVVERRVVRSIKYDGIKSVTVSEILDRFKERRVGLSVESQYDPNKVQRATIALKEFLAERGRQFASVEPDIRQIPPSSLEVTFRVKEGPKVKVGDIDIVGNKAFSDRVVRRAMKNLKPVGIPYSLLFESLFSKSFDSSKLEEDKDRIRNFYQERGYFMARVTEHELNMRDTGGGRFKIPLFYPNRPGKKADLKIHIDEGRLYKLGTIDFQGVKLFRTPQTLMQPLFGMQTGDVFSTEKLRKGIDNMRKLYGEFGHIDFVPEPIPEPVPNSDRVNLTLSVDEGKQFFVRRIDFSGNTTTRDKVIRRELLVDEGAMFNTRLWELSIVRLNQLGYFERLKEDEAQITRDTNTNTVDINLKVKERGRNSIGLTGGVSGIAGTFVGFNYATNNFLGLGETLSVDAQLGDRLRDVTFGFTEPYFLDRPIQLGGTVYIRRFNFDQGREVSILTGRNLVDYYNRLGQQNLLNYNTSGGGFSIFASYPLRRSFARLGLSYGYDRSNVTPTTTAAQTYFEFINFQGLDGPNSLSGIRTGRIVPSYTYNSVDHPITPTRGRSIFVSIAYAGTGLGGNVKMIQPTVDLKYFRKGFMKSHVIGLHAMGSMVSGYGGRTAPPFNRYYIGGEQDIRGFEIWAISPVAYLPSAAAVPVLNADGSARTQKVIVDGVEQFEPVIQQIPVYQMIFPGGDLQSVGNSEYRIPIFGPVTLAGFFDAGINKIIFPGQLKLNAGRLAELNGKFPQAGFDGRAVIAPGTQRMRMSTGLELQIMMPVVNAPFRLYYAYNPMIVQQLLRPPIVVDRASFPNAATFFNAVASLGQVYPYVERRTMFRFTISRTF